MAAIRGNTSFRGTIQSSSDLEVVSSVDFRLNWYTDYPSRIPVKETGIGLNDYFIKSDMDGWQNNLMLLTGLPYILDVYVPNLPVGTNMTMVSQDLEFESIAQPTIASIDSNTVQPNGICRFRVTFANPPAKLTKLNNGRFKPTPVRWNYYVTLKITTSFGETLHRVLVHNSGLGNQPTVGVYDRDELLFLPINKNITFTLIAAGGGGGAIGPVSFANDTSIPPNQRYVLYNGQDDVNVMATNSSGFPRPTTNGQQGEAASVILHGKHRWLNWNIPVSGALGRVNSNVVVRDSAGNLLEDRTILALCVGGAGGGQSNQGPGPGGLALRFTALNNPSQNLVAVGAGALTPFNVTLYMASELALDGFDGNATSESSDGGPGYLGTSRFTGRNPNPYNPNTEVLGQGGMGARRFNIFDRTYNNPQGSSSNNTISQRTGGGGGAGALLRFYLRYGANVPVGAGRDYLPPLVMSVSQMSKIIGGAAGRGTQYGYDGSDGTIEVLEYFDVPFSN